MLVRLTVKATGHMTTTPTLYSLRPVSDDRISIVVLFECSGHMTTAPALYSLRQVVSDDRIRPRSTKVSLISRRKSDAVKNNRGDLSVDNPAIFHDLCSTVTIEHLTLQLRCSTPLFNSSVQLLCSTPQLSYQLLFIIIMNNGRSFSRPTRSYSEDSSLNNNSKGCRRVVSCLLSQTDIPPSVYGDNYWLPAHAIYEGGANACSVTVLPSAKSSSKPSTTL
jgi:hypothetical protein